MKIMSRIINTTATLTILAASVSAHAKDLKYAHFQSADLSSPAHAAALAFESCVEAKTSGSIDVQIYPASQLGNGTSIMESLELGSVQMAVLHDGAISSTYKPFSILAMPYIFDDQAMAWSIIDGKFGKALAADMLKKTGVRTFGLADNGIRNFTNNIRPITSPADMKNLKIRAMSAPVWVKLIESLGASATPISWPELPGALQQGVVDGQENGVTNIVDASLYEHQKYVSLDGHVFSWHAYLMNDQFYQGLTHTEQNAVQQCAQISIIIHRGMTAAQDANATTILKSKGMTVTPISPDQKAKFRAAAQPAVRKYIANEIGNEWIGRLDTSVEAYRDQYK